MAILNNYYFYIAFAAMIAFALIIRFYIAYVRAKNEIAIAETGIALVAAAPAEIANAEQALAAVEKAGEQKMQMCIDGLMLLVPEQLKTVFGEDVIRGIVQNAFDAVDGYAKVAAEKAAKKVATRKKTASK